MEYAIDRQKTRGALSERSLRSLKRAVARACEDGRMTHAKAASLRRMGEMMQSDVVSSLARTAHVYASPRLGRAVETLYEIR